MDKGIHNPSQADEKENNQNEDYQQKSVKPIEYTEIYAWGGKMI